ncbi:MAG: polymer-forming cytoskeletal protein [Gammaproteobacteria bacterium]|nr:polymer-forming cytoskeletal protein [Gammaproteobacteria bacterium]
MGKSHRHDSETSPGPTRSGNSSGTTLIAANSAVNGSLTLSDNLHIDGRVEGEIQSEANVTIGEHGFFEGTIKAIHIIVSGHMEGNIDCQRLEIVASGHVHGELITDDLVIESGGRFIGQSSIRSDNTVQLISSSSKNKKTDHDSDQADQA